MNNWTGTGRFCKDPELVETSSGTKNTKFILAVDRKFKKEGSEKECDFIPCIAWRHTAEFICKYFKKGDKILIEISRIEVSHWQDADDKRIYKTQLVVEQVDFISTKKKSENDYELPEPEDDESAADVPEYDDPEDDGLPF